MSKDGMSRDGRKTSPMHVTLKAGVNGINLENVSVSVEQKEATMNIVVLKERH